MSQPGPTQTPPQDQKPSPLRVGMLGRCPDCGKGRLFQGVLKPVARCAHCDLDMAFADSGDGPAVFVMFIVGFLFVALVLWVEFRFEPPVWLHLVLWPVLISGVSVLFLRWMKGVMIALQFAHDAQQARVEQTPSNRQVDGE